MYTYINPISDIANAFSVSETLVSSWQKTKPHIAETMDLSFSSYSDDNTLRKAIELLSSDHNIATINAFFGLPESINKLEFANVPIITLRTWFKEKPFFYTCFMLGLQQKIINLAFKDSSEEKKSSVLKSLLANEVVELYLASPRGLTKLLAVLE
ncbi:hypothetical protein F7Q91_02875 [Vibrio chagasii]|uniref:Uncharacterized protein n=1 Tax=Vibrio chagasii TaxID=170679 RepID=A0A7V7NWV9_9VIBR|nr:hypothetical protein [Vibrio chagasii]KAB0482364.1 hypothetical protein F7Q91_02875 [Vibrio chagasii]